MRLLITGAAHLSELQIQEIEQMEYEVIFLQYEMDHLPIPYDQVDGVICNGLFLYHDIEKFTNLKYIQLTSAGYDRVPMNYIKEHNIEIYNARGVYSIPMAEFVLAAVLQIYKRSSFFVENQKKHQWEKHRRLIELHEKRVCIVGCGSVGTECAKRFKAFGCCVTGVDLFALESSHYDRVVLLEKLKETVAESDVVVLTLPLTEETRHMFDTDMFDVMKQDAVFVNIARGALVHTEALIQALEQQKIFAVLDVFEEEPLSKDSPLWDMKNAILTPHNSFVSTENNKRLYQVVWDNLVNWSK